MVPAGTSRPRSATAVWAPNFLVTRSITTADMAPRGSDAHGRVMVTAPRPRGQRDLPVAQVSIRGGRADNFRREVCQLETANYPWVAGPRRERPRGRGRP